MEFSISQLRRKIAPVLRRAGIRKAALFGSCARGEQAKDSDIDIVVSPPRNSKFSLFDLSGLELELAAALGRDVDVLTYGGLRKGFRRNVLREQVRIL
jgi:predicted nucleotidyltransferase